MLPVLSPSSDFVDTGSSGLVLCLFGCDIPEGRIKPLAIVISFNLSEQIVPGSIPGWVASLVHEFGLICQSSFPSGHCPNNFPSGSWIGSSRLHRGPCGNRQRRIGAAIGMMDQAWRRLLALDGHGQCRDRHVRPLVVTHRPANDLSGEKLEHDSQIMPSFLGWDIGSVGT